MREENERMCVTSSLDLTTLARISSFHTAAIILIMKVIADINLVPMGIQENMLELLVEADKIIAESGLEYTLHAHGINLCGEFDDIYQITKRCEDHMHAKGVKHLIIFMRVHSRIDKPDLSLQSYLDSVKEKFPSSKPSQPVST